MTASRLGNMRRDVGQSKRRTRRACDRCRLKRSRCDGKAQCKPCVQAKSPCTYDLPRKRDIQRQYCQLHEATDKALQRLYWACRRKEGFPGHPPDLEKSTITNNDILEALGLMGSTINELCHEESAIKPDSTVSSPTSVGSLHTELTQTTVPLPSSGDSEGDNTSPVLLPQLAMKGHPPSTSSNSTLARPDPLPNTTLQETTGTVSEHVLSRRAPEIHLGINSQLQAPISTFEPTRCPPQNNIYQNAYQSNDTKSWIAPADHIEPHLLDPSLGIGAVDRVSFKSQPTSVNISSEPAIEMQKSLRYHPKITGDGFLPPWPGSLEAAYQASQIGRQN